MSGAYLQLTCLACRPRAYASLRSTGHGAGLTWPLFKFTRAILTGATVQWSNGGLHKRDFTFIVRCRGWRESERLTKSRPQTLAYHPLTPNPGTSNVPWRVYNIGSDRPIDLVRYLELIEQACGQNAHVESLPMQPGDVIATHADVSALKAATGHAPRVTVEQGIPQFVEWFRHYYSLWAATLLRQ